MPPQPPQAPSPSTHSAHHSMRGSRPTECPVDEPLQESVSEGDVISVWYQWAGDSSGHQHARKCRPCIVVKAAADGSSIIVVPVSTRQTRDPANCFPIPDQERAGAGLRTECDSWAKTEEVCKIDLPNSAIAPRRLPGGTRSNVRGRISNQTLRQMEQDIAARVRAGTIRKNHMPALPPRRREASHGHTDRAQHQRRPGRSNPSRVEPPQRFQPGDPDSREARMAILREHVAAIAERQRQHHSPARSAGLEAGKQPKQEGEKRPKSRKSIER